MKHNSKDKDFRYGRIQASFTAVLTIVALLCSLSLPSIMVLPQTAYASGAKITAISANEAYALAMKSDGTVWGWGTGPLGNNDADSNSALVPVQAKNLTDVIAISAGGDVALALKNDGTVWSWGSNQYGELGDGSTTNRNSPAPVPSLSGISAIATGYSYCLALKNDGTVWAWGSNQNGALGDGTTDDRKTPVQISGLSGVVSIAANYHSSYAIKSDGTVWAWGLNDQGQLGDGLSKDQWLPINTGLSNIKSLIPGGFSLTVIKQDGSLWQLGLSVNGSVSNDVEYTLVQVPGLSHVVSAAAGQNNFMAILQDQTVWTWGNALPGYGSMNTVTPQPVQVQGLSGTYSAVACLGWYDLALKTDGTVWAWGNNMNGELGDGTKDNHFVPSQNFADKTPMAATVGNVSLVNTLYSEPYAITIRFTKPMLQSTFNTQGNVTLRDDQGQEVALDLTQEGPDLGRMLIKTVAPLSLGQHYTLHLANLMDLDGLTLPDYTYDFTVSLPFNTFQGGVSAGDSHSLSAGEYVMAWGSNTYGQLGDGTNIQRSTPVRVQGLKGQASSVAAGGTHSLALLQDKSVAAWGNNDHGQLGDGSFTNRNTAATVNGLSDIVGIAAGERHSLAVQSDGSVWAWGDNSSGQLGDGTLKERSTPVKVKGLSQVTKIAAGGDTSLAITADGKVWAWGNNQDGQLGDGTTNNQSTPVLVPGLSDVTTVSVGWTHCLALKSDGGVWAWGDNSQSILGTGSADAYCAVPTQVKGLSGVTAISAGNQFSLAMTNQGVAEAWGRNDFNQLGDGSAAKFESTPVQIKNMPLVPVVDQSISAGGYHALCGTLGTRSWGYNASGQLGLGITEHISIPEAISSPPTPEYFRKAGQAAPDTASEIAQTGWAYGAEAAILVNEKSYADALPGTVLAAAVNAPILLTNSQQLRAATLDELQRLKPKTIFILGGRAVVSAQIEQTLKAEYQNVIRIGGYDQYETAAMIARYLKEQNLAAPGKAVVAYGENFPDALAVSSLAAFQHIPILLTKTHSLPSFTQDALQVLQVSKTTVVGGTAVISTEVANQLPGMERFSGMDKYATAIAIAKGMNADLNTVFVATGENFPDALAGSALAARTKSPIVLVNKVLPTVADNFLKSNIGRIREMMVLGGTGVVSDKVMESIADTLDPSHPAMHIPNASPPTVAPIPSMPPAYVPTVTEPQILGASNPDPSLKGPYENGGSLDKLWDDCVYPKQDLTLKWSSLSTPNYLVRVSDSKNGVVFWAYVGDVNTYTLSASIFTEGNDCRISVAGTTGTDRLAPGYKEWYIQAGFYPSSGVLVMIHTLQPPTITSPANEAIVPKKDLTITWDNPNWKDRYGMLLVSYRYLLKDLTINQSGDGFSDHEIGRNSLTIPSSMLATGHTYRLGIEATIGGYNFIPADRQISETTFTVR
ncbi:cell wall-binding repeat-containing protein [Desulfosporosinus sp. OT]|uniref:RCC1 domain-containing protein n=1 Tax=Desulfosporosinus sp. OT TaxID=913865 RepID=UPI000223AB79|nr:cell wall-binding repeat-containing protein [Desulfosporosinus sp. OT]EGW41825.1 cell wall binding repeat 2 family protein [Desulfosporosinus sp. OT]